MKQNPIVQGLEMKVPHEPIGGLFFLVVGVKYGKIHLLT